jgi:uncharacterized protein (DUF111 family)
MKKNRPAVELNVLCGPEILASIEGLIFAETATLGLRTQPVTKKVLPRRFQELSLRGQSIRMKIGPYGVKPEYEDLVAASEALNSPVRAVAAEAVAQFLSETAEMSFPQ